MQAPELIERTKKSTGMSDADLARELGIAYQDVSGWKHGRRTCPPDMRARMAAMCGLDPARIGRRENAKAKPYPSTAGAGAASAAGEDAAGRFSVTGYGISLPYSRAARRHTACSSSTA